MIVVPDALVVLPQWLMWRGCKLPNGKINKPPYSIRHPYYLKGVPVRLLSGPCDPHDSRNWATFEECCRAWQQHPKIYSGIGVDLIAANGIVGIDLDDVIGDSGTLVTWAAKILHWFRDSYQEITVSGGGLRIFVRGSIPAAVTKTVIKDGEPGSVELYNDKRFFVVTGNTWNNSPHAVTDHSADVLELHRWLRRIRGEHTSTQAGRTATNGEVMFGERERYDILKRVLGSLAGYRIKAQIAEELAYKVAEQQFVPQKPEAELRREIAGLMKTYTSKWLK